MTQNEPCCLHQSEMLLDDDDDKLVIKKHNTKKQKCENKMQIRFSVHFKVDTKV